MTRPLNRIPRLAAGIVLGLAALAAAAPKAAFAQQLMCGVSRMAGFDATLWRRGAPARLQIGAALFVGDRLITGPTTRLEIRCTDGAVFTLGVGADLRLEDMVGGSPARGGSVELLEGAAGFLLPDNRRGGAFNVNTPVAVASVRSTQWAVAVRPVLTRALTQQYQAAVFSARGNVWVSGQGLMNQGPGPMAQVDRAEPRRSIQRRSYNSYGDSGAADAAPAAPAPAYPEPPTTRAFRMPPPAAAPSEAESAEEAMAAEPEQTDQRVAEVMVPPSYGVDVTFRGAVGAPRVWPQARVNALRAELGFDW